MLSVDEKEEVFYDSVNYLLPEESVLVEKELVSGDLGYENWLKEPQSVRERREKFLQKMGFIECSTPGELETMGFERVFEDSGAVSSCCTLSSASSDANSDYERRELSGKECCSIDDSDLDWLDDLSISGERRLNRSLLSAEQCEDIKVQAYKEECQHTDRKNNKTKGWWNHLVQKRKQNQVMETKSFTQLGKMTQMKMEQNKKKCMECTAVYAGQEISAHSGLIWTMKFSPDGQYLASGGEDGLICVWRVNPLDASCKNMKYTCCNDVDGNCISQRKKKSLAPIIVPQRIFRIEEEPMQKFYGHGSDVLDLAWSKTNHLLSSSMDNTVRLWQVGCDKCLGVFPHSNYVTCVQFNPADEDYFISGSIDGKVRIWGVCNRRVVDWANVRDLVTAVCYQPNGKGFVAGSVSGTCRFYEKSGEELLLNAEINIQGRKKSGNKITGIQFLKNDSHRVMITSEDSKIHILDGLEVVRKYRGLTKSGSQMSASVTSSGRHIISVGEDSHIYIWNYDDLCFQTSKRPKSTRSCEHFFFEGVSVALPWSDLESERNSFTAESDIKTNDAYAASSRIWDSERFSLANWFSMDSSSRTSTTWPEEKLPLWESPENDCRPCNSYGNQFNEHGQHHGARSLSATWGLVIVTAGQDGMIRTFHNYGLPVRL